MKLILLGPPAAGKGTQAECIAERYSLAHISTGDMLRAEISKKTPLGLRAKALIDDGNLVPDEIINEMVLSRIQHEDCSIGFLLDGYPRTIAQAETLAGAVNIDAVIDINVDSDILIERVSSRRVCRNAITPSVSARLILPPANRNCVQSAEQNLSDGRMIIGRVCGTGSKSTMTEPSRLSLLSRKRSSRSHRRRNEHRRCFEPDLCGARSDIREE